MVQNLLPGTPKVVADAPQTRVGGDAFDRAPMNVPGVSGAAPERNLASGLAQLGAGLEDLSVPLAQRQAAADVSTSNPADPTKLAVGKDASGLPQIFTPGTSFILGRAGEAYGRALESGQQAKASSTIAEWMTNTRSKYETDPQGFLAASKAYASGLQANNPGAGGNALYAHAMNEAEQHFRSLTEAKAHRDTASSLQSITTNIEDTKNQLNALARQGANDTPEYEALKSKLVAGYTALGQDPRFGFGPNKIKNETQRALDDLKAQYIVGQVDKTFTRTSGDGGRAGAQKMLDEQILNNPDLHLSDTDRKQLYAWGTSRLQYLTGQQKAQIDANKAAVDSTIEATRKNPNAVPDAVYDQILSHTRELGDAEGAAKLTAARAVALSQQPMTGLSNEQRFNTMVSPRGGTGGSEKTALDFFMSKGWTQVQAAGIVGNLVRESRLNPGATNRGDGADGSDSIGMGQWNGPRAIALKQFAAKQGKSANDFQTQLEFVQHELETSEANAGRMLKGATDARSAAAAFALGYERPQGFMTGDVMKVSGGGDRVAHAIRLAGGGASSAVVQPSSNGIPFSAEAMKANPFLASEWVRSIATNQTHVETLGKSIGTGLETSTKAGLPVDPTTLTNYFQIAAQHPETFGEQSQKIQAQIIANAGTTGASSPVAAQQFVEAAKAQAESSPSIFHAQVAEAAQTSFTRQAEALKSDPFGEASRRGWIAQAPAPIDFTNGETLTRSLTQHAQAATMIAGHTGVAGTSAISPAEMPGLRSIMTSGSIDQRVALLNGITSAGMSEPVMRATLEQLGKDAPTKPLAVAGDVARYNPQVAHDILQGQALMHADSKLAPNKEDFPTEFSKLLPFNDLPDGPARQNYDVAIQALYAKRSAEANDTTGILNQDRLETVVKDVTGGIVNWRGGKAIAPWYGATQGDYDAAIRLVTDADLAGSRGSDGVPLSASALKPSFSGAFGFGGKWSLQSYDNGKYLVYPNTGQMPRQYLRDTRGQPFVLDLGAKRQAAEASNLKLAAPSFTSTESSFPLDQSPNY